MVYLFLANGFEEIEALCPLDLLRRANIEITTVGIGSETVRGAHGITVHADIPDIMYRDSAPEMIILPGGMPGAKNLDESKTVDVAIKTARKKGAYIAAICAAPFVLGKRGVLDGLNATCFPGFEGELRGANIVTDRGVVVDGNVITARGMGVAQKFGLTLVALLRGEEVAKAIEKSIQTEPYTNE